jgi:hypothetical protein
MGVDHSADPHRQKWRTPAPLVHAGCAPGYFLCHQRREPVAEAAHRFSHVAKRLSFLAPLETRGGRGTYPRDVTRASAHQRRSTNIPRRGVSRANRSKPPTWEGRSEDVITARKGRVASARSLETHEDWYSSLWSPRPRCPIKLEHAPSASGGAVAASNCA